MSDEGSPIEFRLDPGSGVPTYLQLVQQVERALRLGYLVTGDRLPKVKEVVASLAINPNTVLKAYRELEHKGLAAGRPGQGTFVEATLEVIPLKDQQALRRGLLRWLAEATKAGLDEEGIAALVASALHDLRQAGELRLMNVIETHGLAKRYGHRWALRNCTLAVPAGRVVALIGPNGAGKTTLLHLAVGLTRQTCGEIGVLDGVAPGSPVALDGIAFVAQDTPLYKSLSVADTLHLVGSLTDSWDGSYAQTRLDTLGIPLRRKVGQLSGGQQAQVALAVALARHPRLLVLDEPVAELDPLARHDFMSALMEAVAAEGVSVVFSSHVLSELERVCDYLILLSAGNVQVGVSELLCEGVTSTLSRGSGLGGTRHDRSAEQPGH